MRRSDLVQNLRQSGQRGLGFLDAAQFLNQLLGLAEQGHRNRIFGDHRAGFRRRAGAAAAFLRFGPFILDLILLM